MQIETTLLMGALNVLFAIGFAVGGWWAKTLWDAVQALRRDLTMLQVKLAEDYTPNERFEAVVRRMEEVSDDLGNKVDRVIDILIGRTK